MSAPWNFWYHVTSNTKSTWLHGDRRGFRTRHHREHIEGDYKNPPPPGEYDGKLRRSMALLKTPPVILTDEQRVIACRVMAEALDFHKIWFAEIAVGPIHFHLLAQFTPDRTMHNGRPILDPAMHFTGIAKKEAARRLSTLGLRPQGHTWGKKSHVIPVEDEGHFAYLRDTYLPDHVHEGAVIYSMHIAPERGKSADQSPR